MLCHAHISRGGGIMSSIRHPALRSIVLIFVMSLASQALAKPPSFTGIGDLPGAMDFSGANGISGDGSVVVGWGRGPMQAEATRCTSDGGIVSVAGGIPS